MDKGIQLTQSNITQLGWMKFKELFGLDKRSLALLRIGMGVTILYDLYDRSRDLTSHYTDYGLMSRNVVLNHLWSDYWFSIYLMSGNASVVAALFLINVVWAVFLTIGYRTKFMVILNWIFTASLQTRNIIIGHSGDTLQMLLLTWVMFLPIQDCYSVDAMIEGRKNKNSGYSLVSGSSSKNRNNPYSMPNQAINVATVAYIFQILIMYYAAHHLKIGAAWRVDHTAAYLALGLDFFRRPLGDLMLMFPGMLKFSTWAVWNWQGFGPFLYFSPIFTGPLKMFSAFGFFTMHMGFGLAMRLGQFSFITTCGTFGLVPGWAWDTIFAYLRTKERVNFKVFYHPKNRVISTLAEVFKTFFLIAETNVSPVLTLKNDDPESGERSRTDSNKIWLSCQTADGVYHYNSNAFYQMCWLSPILWPFTYMGFGHVMKFKFMQYISEIIRGVIISQTRPGQTSAKTFENQSKEEDSIEIQVLKLTYKILVVLVTNTFAAVLFYIVFARNANSLGYPMRIPEAITPLLHTLHLDQHWAMFTPSPPSSWWWYNIEGELGDHTKVELWANGGLFTHQPNVPHTFDKPPYNLVYLGFKNHRWFKFFENGYNHHPAYETLRLEFGRWVCREYNTYWGGDKRLWKFSVHLMNEVDNPQHDGTRSFAGRQTMWNHLCYEQ